MPDEPVDTPAPPAPVAPVASKGTESSRSSEESSSDSGSSDSEEERATRLAELQEQVRGPRQWWTWGCGSFPGYLAPLNLRFALFLFVSFLQACSCRVPSLGTSPERVLGKVNEL